MSFSVSLELYLISLLPVSVGGLLLILLRVIMGSIYLVDVHFTGNFDSSHEYQIIEMVFTFIGKFVYPFNIIIPKIIVYYNILTFTAIQIALNFIMYIFSIYI